MTKIELNQIEARANAATPGPWFRVDTPFGDGDMVRAGNEDCSGRFICGVDPTFEGEEEDERDFYADMAFIAHARADVPALIARVRELEAAARWIPVEEELPKIGHFLNDSELCLVRTKLPSHFTTAWFEHDAKRWVSREMGVGINVTAWRQIVALPAASVDEVTP